MIGIRTVPKGTFPRAEFVKNKNQSVQGIIKYIISPNKSVKSLTNIWMRYQVNKGMKMKFTAILKEINLRFFVAVDMVLTGTLRNIAYSIRIIESVIIYDPVSWKVYPEKLNIIPKMILKINNKGSLIAILKKI